MYAPVTGNGTEAERDDGTVRAQITFLGFPNEGPTVTGDYEETIARSPAGWRLRRRAKVRQRKFLD